MNKFINKLKEFLIEKYKCETIILYGSYARGDFTKESDVDILCLRMDKEELNDISIFEGKQLDVWVKCSNKELNPQDFLHIRDGKIVFDTNSKGERLLKAVKECFNAGPPKIDKEQKKFLIDWMTKMYNRSMKGDVEGTYRYYWLVKDTLEIYFELNNQWYEGPKKSLKWLEENDKAFFDIYNNILNDGVASENMMNLISRLSDDINKNK